MVLLQVMVPDPPERSLGPPHPNTAPALISLEERNPLLSLSTYIPPEVISVLTIPVTEERERVKVVEAVSPVGVSLNLKSSVVVEVTPASNLLETCPAVWSAKAKLPTTHKGELALLLDEHRPESQAKAYQVFEPIISVVVEHSASVLSVVAEDTQKVPTSQVGGLPAVTASVVQTARYQLSPFGSSAVAVKVTLVP